MSDRPVPVPRADASHGYYGLPLLKEPVWTWEVPAYLFAGGTAGAAAVVGAAARASRADPGLVRRAHGIAAVGGLVSPALLVMDLGRPARFLNMLRVFKAQSPMSVGSWTLVAFSGGAGATAFADLAARRGWLRAPVRVLGDAGEAVAAATGLVMASYTGVLLGATAVPVWAEHARTLPAQFAASAMGSAVSMLELLGRRERALDRLGRGAAILDTAFAVRSELDRRPAAAPLRKGRTGRAVRLGALLSGPLPLALRLLGRRRAAALCTVAGVALTRYGWVKAGHASARDPAPPLALEPPARPAELAAPSPRREAPAAAERRPAPQAAADSRTSS